MLEVKNISVKYSGYTIVDNLSFTLKEKQWLMIIGPNGAGKSTVVNAISQGVPYTGSIYYNGKDITKFKSSQLAKNLGVLTQNHYVGYSFTVEEVVKLGRYAYSSGIFSSVSDEDEKMIKNAMDICGMTEIKDQSVLTLSGGELQRTFLAQLFAQNPGILILDEPTNHLDLVYQKQVFGLIRDWIERTGRSVISVVHDLSLAKAYGTDAILLNKGKLFASGKTDEVLSGDNLNDVYAMDVSLWMKKMLSQWT
jgi:iron complex transport system ATP-binding protein